MEKYISSVRFTYAFPRDGNTFCLMWTISGCPRHCSGGQGMGFQRWTLPGLTKWGGIALHHHLQLSRDGEVLCPSSAALDAQEALAGELIGLEYLFDQTGLVLQDYKAAIEELETGDPDVQEEDDEGFVELVEVQDLTVQDLPISSPQLYQSVPCQSPVLHSCTGYSTTWASVLHTCAHQSPVLRSCSG
ncbi:uncharacterized protein ACWYII_025061 [Salvelinus alpinus]